ncbi:MAG: hypothetical protein ABIH34_01930 [Nanoarchaeota archaeon]
MKTVWKIFLFGFFVVLIARMQILLQVYLYVEEYILGHGPTLYNLTVYSLFGPVIAGGLLIIPLFIKKGNKRTNLLMGMFVFTLIFSIILSVQHRNDIGMQLNYAGFNFSLILHTWIDEFIPLELAHFLYNIILIPFSFSESIITSRGLFNFFRNVYLYIAPVINTVLFYLYLKYFVKELGSPGPSINKKPVLG